MHQSRATQHKHRKETDMPIEFLGIAGLNDSGETHARSGASFDKDYTLRFARAHEEIGRAHV